MKKLIEIVAVLLCVLGAAPTATAQRKGEASTYKLQKAYEVLQEEKGIVYADVELRREAKQFDDAIYYCDRSTCTICR